MSLGVGIEQLPHAIGERVRAVRVSRGWTLDRLAESSGVSRRMVVNVEAGQGNASIATLLKLATALQVSLADLVSDAPAREAVVVTSADEREPLWTGPAGGSAHLIASASTPDMLELWDWQLEPHETYESEPHRHGACELISVTTGHLQVRVADVSYDLQAGDAMSFAADSAHVYANPGRRAARFMMTVFEPLARVRP